jgi:hypothetical protein
VNAQPILSTSLDFPLRRCKPNHGCPQDPSILGVAGPQVRDSYLALRCFYGACCIIPPITDYALSSYFACHAIFGAMADFLKSRSVPTRHCRSFLWASINSTQCFHLAFTRSLLASCATSRRLAEYELSGPSGSIGSTVSLVDPRGGGTAKKVSKEGKLLEFHIR